MKLKTQGQLLVKNISSIVVVLAAIFTIIGVYFQFNQRLKIDCVIDSPQKLTFLPNISGLKVNYTFNGYNVRNLWKINISCTNSGNSDIVGEGDKKNIIHDFIKFNIMDGLNIVNLQKDKSDFPCNISVIDIKSFKIKFSQWKKNETLSFSIYLTSLDENLLPISILLNNRELINGDIIVSIAMPSPNLKIVFLNRLHRICSWILIPLAFFVNIIIIILSIIGIIYSLIKFFQFSNWKKKYYIQFSEYVNTLTHNEDSKKALLGFNKFLADDKLIKIGIPPLRNGILINDISTIIAIIIILFSIFIGSIVTFFVYLSF